MTEFQQTWMVMSTGLAIMFFVLFWWMVLAWHGVLKDRKRAEGQMNWSSDQLQLVLSMLTDRHCLLNTGDDVPDWLAIARQMEWEKEYLAGCESTDKIISNIVEGDNRTTDQIIDECVRKLDTWEPKGYPPFQVRMMQKPKIRTAQDIIDFLEQDDVLIGEGDPGVIIVHHKHWKWEGRAENVIAAARVAMRMENRYVAKQCSKDR